MTPKSSLKALGMPIAFLMLLRCSAVACKSLSPGNEAKGTAAQTGHYIDICFDHKDEETYFSDEVQLTTGANAVKYRECRCIVNNAMFTLQGNTHVTVDQCSVAKLQINSYPQPCGNQQDNIKFQGISNAFISLSLETNYTEEHIVWMTINPIGNATISCSVIPRESTKTSHTRTVSTTPGTFRTTGRGNAKISNSASSRQTIKTSYIRTVSTTPETCSTTSGGWIIGFGLMAGLVVFLVVGICCYIRNKSQRHERRGIDQIRNNQNERQGHGQTDEQREREDQRCVLFVKDSDQANDSAYVTVDSFTAIREMDYGVITRESNV